MQSILRALCLMVMVCLAWPSAQPVAASPYLKGQLLVAAPGMKDPRFRESVILMVNHNAEGAFGLVINKQLGEGNLADLMTSLGMHPSSAMDRKERVFWGGPVSENRLYVLHSPDFVSEYTVIVTDTVSMTAHEDILAAIADGKGPKRARFLIGYSGWGPGQLESEFTRDDWLSVPSGDAFIFDEETKTLWDRASKDAGLSL